MNREDTSNNRAVKFDRKFGEAIIHFRSLAGLTQRELGERIGVSTQQVQKYEMGANRVSIWRAVQIAKVLRLALSLMVEMADPETASSKPPGRETTLLMRGFARIENQGIRRAIVRLVASLSTNSN